MENFSYHVPFYVVTGGIATSGHSSDLRPGQVGLFDRQTFSVATSIGNGKEFFFAQGAIGGKDWYGRKVDQTHKSPFFLGEDVTNMYLSKPQAPINEEWVLGFNGSPSSNGLSFTTNVPVRVKFYFHGEPTYRFFNGPKEYVVSHTPKGDCTQPCNASDCPDGIVDCMEDTMALIDKINNHTELQKFGVVAKLVTNTYSPAATTMIKWCLDVCDNGDALALQAVQAQVPAGETAVRIARSGSTSTYQFCRFDDEVAIPDFAQSATVLQAICGECPAGSTLTEAKSVYFVSRPLLPSDDVDDASAQQTFADTVGSAYETAFSKTFDGATDVEVVAASDAITITNHGFQTGNKVNYTDGGGTQIVGLVDTTDYFVIRVDANTIKLATTAANAYAGTAIAIADGVGAAHNLAPVITAAFVANQNGNALIKLTLGQGIVLTALLSDSIAASGDVQAICTFATPTPIAWTNCGAGIRSQRTLRLNNINRLDCDGGNRLADLASVLAGVVGIQIGTLAVVAGTDCKDDYTVNQYSVDCLDEACLTSNVTFHYDDLPSFENEAWNVVPAAIEEDDTRKCGIRITAGYIDPKFGNCSFNPDDYFNMEPLKMEVSLLGEDWDHCDFADRPTQSQSRIGQIGRQQGEWVVREVIMKTDAYQKHIDQFSLEPRMREAFDMNLLGMVDRNAYYKLYYVTYAASYGKSFRKKAIQEQFTTVFAFKEGDAAATTFETQILNVLTAKSDVVLHVHEGNIGGSSGQQGA